MHSFIEKLARRFAQLGGIVLVALIVLICASVFGRSMNGFLHSDLMQNWMPGFADALLATGIGPINGDFEIVEAGIAFAIFSFIPICQLSGAHATVDIFTSYLSERVNAILRVVTDILFAAVLLLLTWQLILGGASKYRSGQTTLLLEFPVWWSYAASIVAMIVAAIAGVYVAVSRVTALATGRESPLVDDGAEH